MITTRNGTRAPERLDQEADVGGVRYRAAVTDDSRFIVSMIELSSDGIASLEWQQKSAELPGLEALDIGCRQYAKGEGDYSYRSFVIAEVDKPVGMILSFPVRQENLSVTELTKQPTR